MADAKASLVDVKTLASNATIEVYGTLKVTAGPDTYPAGGLPLDLVQYSPGSSAQPLFAEISSSVNASAANMYVYDYTNKKVRIYTGVASGPPGAAEITGGAAIPAGVSGDTARVHTTFAKFQ